MTERVRIVLAIDPGTTQSAFARLVDGEPIHFATLDNVSLLLALRNCTKEEMLVIEHFSSYGMPVGAEVFETCLWIGRFIEAWGGEYELIYRRDVKLHLCNSARAKDANVAQALRDRFGEKGTKAKPGLLYGIKADEWSALAVAVTWWDVKRVVK